MKKFKNSLGHTVFLYYASYGYKTHSFNNVQSVHFEGRLEDCDIKYLEGLEVMDRPGYDGFKFVRVCTMQS